MKIKYVLLIALLALGATFVYSQYKNVSIPFLLTKDNHCDSDKISQDIYSLSDSYTQEEKEEVGEVILSMRKQRGEC